MERRWCWRCGTERGYLDEVEAGHVDALRERSFRDRAELELKGFEQVRALLTPAVERYVELTGEDVGTNPNYWWYVVLKHRLSEIGCPCRECGRPLRTPRARVCANCGWPLV